MTNYKNDFILKNIKLERMTESLEHKVYYINDVFLTRKEMKRLADKVTAVIEVVFNRDENTITVSNLFSNKKDVGLL